MGWVHELCALNQTQLFMDADKEQAHICQPKLLNAMLYSGIYEAVKLLYFNI